MTAVIARGRDDEASATPPRWGVVGFTALIAVTPATPHLPIAGSFLDYSDLTTIAAALLGLVAVARSGAWRSLRIRRAPEAYAMALMVPFTLIAAVHAGSVHSVAAGPARWLLNAVVLALAYLLLRSPADGGRMIRAIVAVAAFEAVFGLVSYAVQFSTAGGYIGITFVPGPTGKLTFIGRITGTTGMASTFIGGLFALALPMAVGLAMASRHRMRWVWSACAVLIFAALALTLSRTPIALGALAVAVLLLAATRPRVWLPVLAVGAVAFLATPLRGRMLDFDNDRLALWDAGWRMFLDHPLFGVGPDRYMDFFAPYQHTPFGLATATPHNSLLYVAAESGVLAALALALAIALSLRFLRVRNPLVLGPMLGLAAFAVDAMTTNLYSISSIAVVAWMVAPAVAPLVTRAGRVGGARTTGDGVPAGGDPVGGARTVGDGVPAGGGGSVGGATNAPAGADTPAGPSADPPG